MTLGFTLHTPLFQHNKNNADTNSMFTGDDAESIASSVRTLRFSSQDKTALGLDLKLRYQHKDFDFFSKVSSHGTMSNNVLYKLNEDFRVRFSLISSFGNEGEC
jgi:hypothetical protein